MKTIRFGLFLSGIFVLVLLAATPTVAVAQFLPAAPPLNPDGAINTNTGMNGALDLHGWHVTLDSQRGPIFAPAAAPSAPNNGLNTCCTPSYAYGVNAMAMLGSDLFVGGSFTATADASVTFLNYIAKYSKPNPFSLYFFSPLANAGHKSGVVKSMSWKDTRRSHSRKTTMNTPPGSQQSLGGAMMTSIFRPVKVWCNFTRASQRARTLPRSF